MWIKYIHASVCDDRIWFYMTKINIGEIDVYIQCHCSWQKTKWQRFLILPGLCKVYRAHGMITIIPSSQVWRTNHINSHANWALGVHGANNNNHTNNLLLHLICFESMMAYFIWYKNVVIWSIRSNTNNGSFFSYILPCWKVHHKRYGFGIFKRIRYEIRLINMATKIGGHLFPNVVVFYMTATQLPLHTPSMTSTGGKMVQHTVKYRIWIVILWNISEQLLYHI